jgi:hypothetical protein
MFFLALLQAAPSLESDALQTILDGVAQGNIVMSVIGGIVLIGLVILGIIKRDHPLVKPIAGILLKAARAFSKPKADPAKEPGLPAVVPIKKLDQTDDPEQK